MNVKNKTIAQHTQYKKEKLKFIKNLKVTTKGNIKLLT